MKKPYHIPKDILDKVTGRYMNFLHALDKIYAETRLRYLEADQISMIIITLIDAYSQDKAFGKVFVKQLKGYELTKYLYPDHLIQREILVLVGYRPHGETSITFRRNNNIIQGYIDVKDPEYYYDILEVDEKIRNVLIN